MSPGGFQRLVRISPDPGRLFQALCLILPPLSVLSSNALVPLLLLAALLLGLGKGSGAGRFFVRNQGISVLLALLLLWAALTSVWSFQPLDAFFRIARVAVLVGAGLVLLGAAQSYGDKGDNGNEKRARLAPWLTAGVCLGVLVFLVELLLDFPIYRLANQLDAADPVYPSRLNHGAAALAMLAWPLAAMWAARLGRNAWLLPLVVLPVIAPTESLAAQTGYIVGYLTAGFFFFAPKAGRALLISVLVVGFLGAPLIAKGLSMVGMDSREWLPVNNQARVYIWNFVADRTLERPLFGWGMNASRDMPNYGVETFLGTPGPVIPLHPHNAILQIWLELGGVGVFLFLGLLLMVLRSFRSLPEPERIYAYALFATTLMIAIAAWSIWLNQWIAAIILAGAFLPLCRTSRISPHGEEDS